VNKQSHCCCLPPLNASERHCKASAMPVGVKHRMFWHTVGKTPLDLFIYLFFPAKWKRLFMKPLQKYLLLLDTTVSAVLNDLCALKTHWGVHLLHKRPFTSKISVHQWFTDVHVVFPSPTAARFLKGFSDVFPPIFCLPSSI